MFDPLLRDSCLMIMLLMKLKRLIQLLLTLIIMSIIGCGEQTGDIPSSVQTNNQPPVLVDPDIKRIPAKRQFNIGNTNYLFDVSDHSMEELEALLKRVEAISEFESTLYDQLEIVMILHGPDIEWFRQENYDQNRQLIELAKKLDNYDVVDMKVCKLTMEQRGVSRNELPAFIETVPFAPDEFNRLLGQGYINL